MQKLNHFKFSITRNSQYIITPFHKSPNIFFILKQNSDKFKNLIAVLFKPYARRDSNSRPFGS